MYFPILHILIVELHCKLQEKLHRVTGPLIIFNFFFRLLSSLKSLRSLNVYGFLTDPGLSVLRKALKGIDINKNLFSTIARPTGSTYTRNIWNMKCLGPC